MANILTNLTENFSDLTPTKKLFLGFTFAGGFALIAVLWLWTQKPDFKVLYTNLSSEDAGAVVGKFKEMNVPYQFSENGSAILVPSERVHELRLQLASQGLPQGGGVGFEIFDQTAFGTTEFSQKLNYRRALQGELARTIAQIEEVSKARVHLVIPERALFSEQQERSQAAVVVHLKPGRHLTNRQVKGITNMVASSVEGLTPSGVTVVDSEGKVRTKDSEESSFFQMNHSQLEYQKNIEKKMEQNIQTMLARVVGPQKAVVRVSSKLDLRQVELTEERYDPEAQVVRSEQRSQEDTSESSNTGKSGGPGGVPGVDSNLPAGEETKTGGGAANQNNSRMNNVVINYEISKSVSRIIEPFGTIKQLSVAALIDGSYETITNDAGETSKKYLPRSEEEMKKLEAIVKKAMGYSTDRNDQVEVVNIPFKSNADLDEALPPKPMVNQIMQWMPLARQIIGPLLILLVLFAVIKPIIKTAMMTPPQQTPIPALAGAATSDGMGGLPESEGRASVTGPEGQEAVTGPGGASTSDVPKLEEPKTDREGLPTQEDIVKLAQETPQVATQLVKKWIEES
ncbi:MAG: flagellar basal-body MS-ring/collar protein FliF [Nitrospiria bacterium]